MHHYYTTEANLGNYLSNDTDLYLLSKLCNWFLTKIALLWWSRTCHLANPVLLQVFSSSQIFRGDNTGYHLLVENDLSLLDKRRHNVVYPSSSSGHTPCQMWPYTDPLIMTDAFASVSAKIKTFANSNQGHSGIFLTSNSVTYKS